MLKDLGTQYRIELRIFYRHCIKRCDIVKILVRPIAFPNRKIYRKVPTVLKKLFVHALSSPSV